MSEPTGGSEEGAERKVKHCEEEPAAGLRDRFGSIEWAGPKGSVFPAASLLQSPPPCVPGHHYRWSLISRAKQSAAKGLVREGKSPLARAGTLRRNDPVDTADRLPCVEADMSRWPGLINDQALMLPWLVFQVQHLPLHVNILAITLPAW